MLKKHVLPVLGNLVLRRITVSDMTDFFAKVRHQKPSDKYLLNLYALLNIMFEVAREHDLIDTVPLRRKIHRPKCRRAKKIALSIMQLAAFLEVVERERPEHKALFWTVAVLGLRVGELLALRWRRIDFANVSMKRLYGTINPASGPSLAPCSFTDVPTSEDWCGLNWSARTDVRSAIVRAGVVPGVYKLMDEEDVVYIGESRSLANRLQAYTSEKDGLSCSYVPMANALAYQRHERETDLIGAYYKYAGSPPRLQYRRRQPRVRPQLVSANAILE